MTHKNHLDLDKININPAQQLISSKSASVPAAPRLPDSAPDAAEELLHIVMEDVKA